MRVQLARSCMTLAAFVALAGPASAQRKSPSGEWPQWRGPERNGISQETGLLRQWPKGGPQLAWKASGLGEGYSSVSVSGGRVYTMGNRGSNECVLALDASNGRPIWSATVGTVRAGGGGYPGPRSTPTVDGTLVYALGINGDLVCLEAATGKERWRHDLPKEFQGSMMSGWGYSESPLVDGDKLLCTPGGNGATIIALNKKTGKPIWKSSIPSGVRGTATEVNAREGDRAAYSSIVIGQIDGVKQYIQFLGTGVAGIAARDGKFLWRYNKPANGTANISTPIFADDCVFAASGYNTGGGLVRLSPRNSAVVATEVYFTNHMKNHHGGVILVGDHLYGFDEAILRCLEFKTGAGAWENRSVGKGSLVYADGHLYARSESGPVALVEATPSGYTEKGRFDQPERSGQNAWAHPVVAGGRLYLRDQDILLCYDVRDRAASGQAAAE